MAQPRIALVTQAMRMGGVETYLLRLGAYLQQAGYEVEVITTAQRGEWFDRISERGLKARAITKRHSASALLHSVRVARELSRGHYDIIFLNHAKFAQRAITLLPDDIAVIPVLHNDLENIYHVGLAHTAAWNVAVAVGQKVYDVARSRVPDRPIVQIPYGVEMPSPAACQARRGFETPLRLLFVGRLAHEHKGVLLLPDIVQQCRARGLGVTLTIAGEGEDRAALLTAIEARDITTAVSFLGAVPPDRVYELMLDSHILLLPSFYEGLPITLLEAQACGCVPIASRLEGITDQAIGDGRTGRLVPVGDVAGFVDTVAELTTKPAQWKQWSGAAHQRAVEQFSVEAMGRAYEGLIQDALAGRYPLPQPRHTLGWRSLWRKL